MFNFFPNKKDLSFGEITKKIQEEYYYIYFRARVACFTGSLGKNHQRNLGPFGWMREEWVSFLC